MSLYQKIALALSVTVLVTLAAVSAFSSSRSAEGQNAPEAEQSGAGDFQQNIPQIPEELDFTEEGIPYDLYMADGEQSPDAPPFAGAEDEVLEFLPARPGFLKPALASDPEAAAIADSDADDGEGAVTEATTEITTEATTVVTTEAATEPTTEATTQTTPATTAKPVPETTKKPETQKPVTESKKPETTQTKPVTEAKPEPVIPEGSDLRTAIISVAKSQIGVKEEPYNNVKYNTWFYGKEVCEAQKGQTRYAWCVVFLAWCADRADVPQSVIPKIGSVSGLKSFFVNQGRYYSGSEYTPKAGDIVFFKESHAGIVVSVEDGKVTVVEGNYSDSVAKTTYDLGSSKMTGFGSPKY